MIKTALFYADMNYYYYHLRGRAFKTLNIVFTVVGLLLVWVGGFCFAADYKPLALISELFGAFSLILNTVVDFQKSAGYLDGLAAKCVEAKSALSCLGGSASQSDCDKCMAEIDKIDALDPSHKQAMLEKCYNMCIVSYGRDLSWRFDIPLYKRLTCWFVSWDVSSVQFKDKQP